MTYQKQYFTDGQVLSASQLNTIEQGIVDNENAIAQKQDKGDYVTKTEANNSYASKGDTYTKTEVDNKIANAGSGGSGLSENAKSLLITLLSNAVFTTDQSNNIALLEIELFSVSTDPEPEPDVDMDVTQDSNRLFVRRGVTVTQNNEKLMIA